MSLIVNSNIAALNAQRNIGVNNSQLSKSLEKLSSGLRINRAADDAAGLAIATKFAAQVKGLNQAVRNANNTISLVQTAEGGVDTLTKILQRLRELAVQASSDDNTPADRAVLNQEAKNAVEEFTRIANTSEFNTMPLLDGSFANKYFQIGSNYAQTISFDLADTRARSVGARAEFDANIADGVTAAKDANFGAAEFKVNGYAVAATNSTDDQYSVLDISSGQSAGGTVTSEAAVNLHINGVSIQVFHLGSGSTIGGASAAAGVKTAIEDAIKANPTELANITVRGVGSVGWVIEAKNGTDLTMQVSFIGSATASMIGIQSLVDNVIGSGVAITAYNGQSSAIAKAVAINAVKTNSGVTATARANTVTGQTAIAEGTIGDGTFYINGVNIGDVNVAAQDSTGALVTAINNKSAETGVTASKDANNKLVLTAADGRNITVTADSTAQGVLKLGTPDAGATYIFRSTVKLNSESTIKLTGTLADLYQASSSTDRTGDTSKSIAPDVSQFNIAKVDLSTQENAESAILTIDSALNNLNDLRAKMGAIQNRLEFAVSNLEVAAENMSASESRIRDADFAAEVAQFTRNQVMVQAGTAMLAQANTTSQIALQLLR